MTTLLFLFSLNKYYGALGLAVIAFVMLRSKISEQKLYRMNMLFFFGFLALCLMKIIVWYGAQYSAWSANEQSIYLLPPHQPIQYFFSYVWFRFARPEIMNIGVALFFFLIFFLLQRVSRGRMFYEHELYGAGFAFLANPWPQNLLLLPMVLCAGCLNWAVRFISSLTKHKTTELVSLRIWWPLCGLAMVFAGAWLTRILGLTDLYL